MPGKFLPVYIEKGILKNDPFQILGSGRCRAAYETWVLTKAAALNQIKNWFCANMAANFISNVLRQPWDGLCKLFSLRVPIARVAAQLGKY